MRAFARFLIPFAMTDGLAAGVNWPKVSWLRTGEFPGLPGRFWRHLLVFDSNAASSLCCFSARPVNPNRRFCSSFLWAVVMPPVPTGGISAFSRHLSTCRAIY
eukprot:6200366-Pleurochrysis_carterae.AAC.1